MQNPEDHPDKVAKHDSDSALRRIARGASWLLKVVVGQVIAYYLRNWI